MQELWPLKHYEPRFSIESPQSFGLAQISYSLSSSSRLQSNFYLLLVTESDPPNADVFHGFISLRSSSNLIIVYVMLTKIA